MLPTADGDPQENHRVRSALSASPYIMNRMNDAKLKKITYLMIGVSGVINLFA